VLVQIQVYGLAVGLVQQQQHSSMFEKKVIYIPVFNFYLNIFAAGHATESFSDFVVGHGELWSAQMLSYAIKKVNMRKAR
jgi:aspartokinase